MIKVTVNLDDFLGDFNLAAQQALANMQFSLREATDNVFKEIVSRTPVGNPTLWKYSYAPADYTPGQLKASWALKYTYTDRLNSGVFAVIHNPQPYAERIEFGAHSTQAPYGMLRLSLQNYANYIQEAIKRNKI